MIIRGSVVRQQAVVLCPCCPEDSDGEALATVVRVGTDRGLRAILDRLEGCPLGHKLSDLTPEQEARTLESALDWLHDAREALRDAATDARLDDYRNEGRYDYR